jgi:cytoskeletal protein CcmA (bactofilin family)
MFGKSKDGSPDTDRAVASIEPQPQRPAMIPSSVPAPRAAAGTGDDTSSISAGMTIVGKISGKGAVTIYGRVEGELHASTVLIAQGADVEGDIVADEVSVGGRVKGTIHANRVQLNSTAAVEGDIFHRSLSIEENARFEGTSRREGAAADAPRVPLSRPPSQVPMPSHAVDASPKIKSTPDNGAHVNPVAV